MVNKSHKNKLHIIKIESAFQINASAVTLDDYTHILQTASGQYIEAGILDDIKSRLGAGIGKLISEFGEVFSIVKEQTGAGVTEIVKAFKSPSVFAFLKAVKFNLSLVMKALTAASKLAHSGLMIAFKKMAATGVWKDVQSGARKIDDVIAEYPILKKLSGIALAGLLIYVSMTYGLFTGNPISDFDFTDLIHDALTGQLNFLEFITSDTGLSIIANLLAGQFNIMQQYTVYFNIFSSSASAILVVLAVWGFKEAHMSGLATSALKWLKSNFKHLEPT